MAALPPEIWSHVVRYTNMPDWINLSRVSKDLQRMAETRIYFSLYVRDPQIASAISHALTVRRAFRGKYVHRFWFWMDTRLANRTTELEMSEAFWEEMQRAFAAMVNLEVLSLHDPDASNSWVLDTPDIKFQLIELYVGFAWDAHFVQFLQTQSRLRMLQADETVEDGPLHSLAPGSLPSLSMFTGPALILSELLDSPLTHVQVMLEEETLAVLPGVIYDLGRAKTKLQSINVLHAPEALMMEVVQLLSKSNLAQTLRYLGVVPLPVLDVSLPGIPACSGALLSALTAVRFA